MTIDKNHILDGCIARFNEGSDNEHLAYQEHPGLQYELFLRHIISNKGHWISLTRDDQVYVVQLVKQMCRERGIPNS